MLSLRPHLFRISLLLAREQITWTIFIHSSFKLTSQSHYIMYISIQSSVAATRRTRPKQSQDWAEVFPDVARRRWFGSSSAAPYPFPPQIWISHVQQRLKLNNIAWNVSFVKWKQISTLKDHSWTTVGHNLISTSAWTERWWRKDVVSIFTLWRLRADVERCVSLRRVDLLYLPSMLAEHMPPPVQKQWCGIIMVLSQNFQFASCLRPSSQPW